MRSLFLKLKSGRSKGEIATTLTVLSMVIIAFGVLVGASIVSQRDPSATSSEAQSDNTTATVQDYDPNWIRRDEALSGIKVLSASLRPSTKGSWNAILDAEICLTNQPKLNDQYRLVVDHKGLSLGGGTAPGTPPLGASVVYRVTNASAFKCDNVVKFSSPITLPNNPKAPQTLKDRVPAGYECLPTGNLSAYLTLPDSQPANIGDINRAFFGSSCPDTSETPTPIPTVPTATTPTPQTVTINIDIEDSAFQSNFNKVFMQAKFCDDQGKNCTRESDIKSVEKNSSNQEANSSHTLTINNAPATGRLFVFTDYYRDDNKIDNSGVSIYPNTYCNGVRVAPGQTSCVVNSQTQNNLSMNVKLPDPGMKTYTVSYYYDLGSGNSRLVDTCWLSISTDSEEPEGAPYNGSCASFTQDTPAKGVLEYMNDKSSSEYIFWQVNLCNGTMNDNSFTVNSVGTDPTCQNNNPNRLANYVSNTYSRSAETIPANNSLTCKIDTEKFNFDLANISKSAEAITCVKSESEPDEGDNTPSATPPTDSNPTPGVTNPTTGTGTPIPDSNSPTPLPTDNPDNYRANVQFVLTNNTGVADVTKVTFKLCYTSTDCVTESVNTRIKADKDQPQRGRIEKEFPLRAEKSSYSLACTINFSNGKTVNCPNEVKVLGSSNIIFRLVAGIDDKISGFGATDVETSDVNGDGCNNAADFGLISGQYGEIIEPTEISRYDLNFDSVVNSFDLSTSLITQGEGARCGLVERPNSGGDINVRRGQ